MSQRTPTRCSKKFELDCVRDDEVDEVLGVLARNREPGPENQALLTVEVVLELRREGDLIAGRRSDVRRRAVRVDSWIAAKMARVEIAVCRVEADRPIAREAELAADVRGESVAGVDRAVGACAAAVDVQ